LHTLTLPLDTAESAIELFTILQTNTALEALSVEIKVKVYSSNMGISLQEMLIKNKTLKYLEIDKDNGCIVVPSSFLSFLTTGLRHNNSLQHLSVSIPPNEEMRGFISVASQKDNLTELEVNYSATCCYLHVTVT
uniref:Uncharacterized protein n=1 Tax=Amphimedon queenslandica TaxID=400682 RepID=A0A1X7T023_AMPQE